MPNKHAQLLGRKGGRVSSPAKAAAARRNMKAFWDDVAAGRREDPRKKKPEIVKPAVNGRKNKSPKDLVS